MEFSRFMERFLSASGAAWGVLIISLLATAGVYHWAREQAFHHQQVRFDQAVAKFRHTMEVNFSVYYNILNALKSFSIPSRTPAEFRQFVKGLDMDQDHRFVYDFGYVERVRAQDLPHFLSYARSMGMDEKHAPELTTITNEDFVLVHWDDFGVHTNAAMASLIIREPRRVAAMRKACDLNSIASTEALEVRVGRDVLKAGGFIMYAPVYALDAPTGTLEERRAALKGFVFASVSISEFWDHIYLTTSEPDIDFEVYDGRTMNADKLWHDCQPQMNGTVPAPGSRPPRFKTVNALAGVGREWSFYHASLPSFEVTSSTRMPLLFLWCGGCGSLLLFVLSFMQVKARQRAERLAQELRVVNDTLAEGAERLSVTLGSIHDGVMALDNQGRIVLMNPAAESLTGCTLASATGKGLSEVFVAVDAETGAPLSLPLENVLRTGQHWGSHSAIRLTGRGDNNPILEIALSPLRDPQGASVGLVLVFRDVTERRKLIEEQIKRSKLESIGLLAGGIAHDFNNLLTTINGNISMAAMEPGVPSSVREFLRDAESAGGRARDLTQQLLTFAKGGAPVRKTTLLNRIIRDSARFGTHGSKVACNCILPGDLWPVDADAVQMGQVIHNMVINAAQAMPEGGTVTIRGENVTLDSRDSNELAPGRYVKISIEDCGTGIAPAHLPKIFDPYFSTKQRGSGLGLATAYSIIKRHEGVITVQSEPGRGTRFEIFLPASTQPVEEGMACQQVPVASGHGSILIMDDEPGVRTMLARMLERLGYQVTATAEGAEAVQSYSEAQQQGRPIDLVILDLTVPGGMGGEQAFRQILALDPGARGVVSSGYSDNPVMANFKSHGFVAALPKPFGIDQLGETLAQVLSNTSGVPSVQR